MRSNGEARSVLADCFHVSALPTARWHRAKCGRVLAGSEMDDSSQEVDCADNDSLLQ